MKIIHYSLGIQPYRTGGLIKYVEDLISKQVDDNSVFLIYPGSRNYFFRDSYLKKISVNKKNMQVFDLVNSFPLPLFGGISDPNVFFKEISLKKIDYFSSFFKKYKPDIVHIHTFMGLPIEFILAAKNNAIPLVFTTHDYFGLAPVPNFYNEIDDYSFDSNNTVEEWIKSSQEALSLKKMLLFQCRFYPQIRKIIKKNNLFIISKRKKKPRKCSLSNEKKEKFIELREYYYKMLSMIDIIHANSEQSKKIYKRYLPNSKIVVHSITSSDISFSKQTLDTNFINNKHSVRLGFIGSEKNFKGYKFLLNWFNTQKNEFKLKIYGNEKKVYNPNVEVLGKYSPIQKKEVFNNIDILIVPSKCKETFGLVVLEALSLGTPVLVSENVGAKDLLEENLIFSLNNDSLTEKINLLLAKLKNGTDKTIDLSSLSLSNHVTKINNLYLDTITMHRKVES
ncbi:glycosyltransferase [Enterococcus lactis]|uniref:glycosyltransferase n=2 Tax=Enterococcus lactis TaxID=357441 RepID=UPI002412DBAD|nr:glycosyltransferase [Enterococcus lactis]